MASRNEHPENSNRSECFNEVRRNVAEGFDLCGTRNDIGSELAHVGQHTLGGIRHDAFVELAALAEIDGEKIYVRKLFVIHGHTLLVV